MESNPRFGRVDFGILRGRLKALVIGRIDNGEFTERGFARILGISQPQVHNVLKGVRKLSPELADLILAKLNLSVLDLLTDAEIREGVEAAGQTSTLRKPPAAETKWTPRKNGTTD